MLFSTQDRRCASPIGEFAYPIMVVRATRRAAIEDPRRCSRPMVLRHWLEEILHRISPAVVDAASKSTNRPIVAQSVYRFATLGAEFRSRLQCDSTLRAYRRNQGNPALLTEAGSWRICRPAIRAGDTAVSSPFCRRPTASVASAAAMAIAVMPPTMAPSIKMTTEQFVKNAHTLLLLFALQPKAALATTAHFTISRNTVGLALTAPHPQPDPVGSTLECIS